jgi:uncharacterized protein YcaQ
MPALTLDDLRRHAIARSLFRPTTLARAIERLGFVQADPIRAPARAQDLTLRHRVAGYRAGDLERRYPRLPIEEDCFVNYGFLPRRHLALMHPRTPKRAWDAATRRRADELLAYVRERGPTHPREALAAFDHGRVAGYWGGTLNATTQLLDGMHYRGLLRVVRRDNGTRVYAAADHAPDAALAPVDCAQALLTLVVDKYAPLPAPSLTYLARLLEYGAPQLRPAIQAALPRLRETLPSAQVDGLRWYWPAGENPASKQHVPDQAVRLLAPFDPIVWDRRRFELLWGWVYKFEAYTPPARRRYGHYALPLLWGEQVIGWANASVQDGALRVETGYADGRARRERGFRAAFDAERQRLAEFLGDAGVALRR